MIVEDVDDALVALDWDRRRNGLGPLVAQLDVVGQPVFEEDLTRPIRSTERIQGVDTVVSVPAWEGPHQELVHKTTAGHVVVRCDLFEPGFVMSGILQPLSYCHYTYPKLVKLCGPYSSA